MSRSSLPRAGDVVLDPGCFPHLLDAILDQASYPALLSLRNASRTLRAHIDAHFLDHTTLHQDPETSKRRDAADEWWEFRLRHSRWLIATPDSRLIPVRADAPLAAEGRRTRVLSVRGSDYALMHFDTSIPLDDLRVLRLLPPEPSALYTPPPPQPTHGHLPAQLLQYVHSYQHTAYSSLRRPRTRDLPDRDPNKHSARPPAPRTTLPRLATLITYLDLAHAGLQRDMSLLPAASRVVVNVYLDAARTSCALREADFNPRTKSITYLFRPPRTPGVPGKTCRCTHHIAEGWRSTPPVPLVSATGMPMRGVLRLLIDEAAHNLWRADVTFVGVEQLARVLSAALSAVAADGGDENGVFRAALEDGLEKAMRGWIAERAERMPWYEERGAMEVVEARLRFVSEAGYAGMISEEQLRLELLEDEI